MTTIMIQSEKSGIIENTSYQFNGCGIEQGMVRVWRGNEQTVATIIPKSQAIAEIKRALQEVAKC